MSEVLRLHEWKLPDWSMTPLDADEAGNVREWELVGPSTRVRVNEPARALIVGLLLNNYDLWNAGQRVCNKEPDAVAGLHAVLAKTAAPAPVAPKAEEDER